MPKLPRAGEQRGGRKEVRLDESITDSVAKKRPQIGASNKEERPLVAWRFSTHDKGGRWAWTNLNNPGEYKETIEKLHSFETMDLTTINKAGSHRVELARLSKEARKRLEKIRQDDVDYLMSFRLSGKKRIWCIADINIMKILWWDPDHTVCPAPKRHT